MLWPGLHYVWFWFGAQKIPLPVAPQFLIEETVVVITLDFAFLPLRRQKLPIYILIARGGGWAAAVLVLCVLVAQPAAHVY